MTPDALRPDSKEPNAAWEILPSIAYGGGFVSAFLTKSATVQWDSEAGKGLSTYYASFYAVVACFAFLIVRGLLRDRTPRAPVWIDLFLSLLAGAATYTTQILVFQPPRTVGFGSFVLLSLGLVALAAFAVVRIGALWARSGPPNGLTTR